MSKKFKIILSAIAAFFLLIVFIYIGNPKKIRRYVRDLLGLTCWDYHQTVYSKKLADKLVDYIAVSSSTGIRKCKNEKEIMEYAASGKLKEIKDCKAYYLDNLSHSYPYLTKDAKELLDEIADRFGEKISNTRLKGSKFKITSVTRTTEKLKSLRGVNSNASLNSPHMYGNTFDISYKTFKTHKYFMTNCDDKYLMEALAEVIWQLRKEKKCWATFEKSQNCYHVVAR
ncbi:MAG: hypothetical protein H6540_05750 [Bacteroidales bacterium]|nr:hypothetical protein [Bacteroidales bacterium]MCB9013678.1 hypothetical protein [Bacteroidales bacterium]